VRVRAGREEGGGRGEGVFAEKSYPIYRIPDGHGRPRKGRILRRRRLGVGLHRLARPADGLKLRQPLVVGPVAEVAEDEALHARGFGGVHQAVLRGDALDAHGGDDGILAAQCRGERRDVEVRTEHGHVDWEDRRGARAGDDCEVEAGGREGQGDGSADGASSLNRCLLELLGAVRG
jgi:hypothetical protein